MNRLIILFNTIKYLKKRQIYYRLFYFVRLRWRKFIKFHYPLFLESSSELLCFQESIKSYISCEHKTFTFLHFSHTFEDKIDWNLLVYGKLWTYNLTYFEYLNQKEISQKKGLMLVNNFIDQIVFVQDAIEPYPISLRGINWIKFLSKHKIEDPEIDNSLYAQYYILIDNIEYHLLGNHLLENAFSLLFGAYYFQDEKFYAKAKKILTDELEEQILDDGAHFELSPMYHQIMLFRVLDCINLVQNNNWKNQELLQLLTSNAEIMLGWLNTMTFNNGNVPLFNDSANKIAPTTKELNNYALELKLETKEIELSSSGYRKVRNNNYEMIMDVGDIGPDYIPGHAHSDTFNFELYVGNQPVIVDTGLSTYETNDRRQLERSTRSHNTVEVDGENQSEVWGGFRVARRAKIIELKEFADSIKATHDGYVKKGILHTREFITYADEIIVTDSLNTKKEHSCVAYIHFHPNVNVYVDGNELICKDLILSTSNSIELIEYEYSPEFNIKIKAKCAKITFQNTLEVKIKIKKYPES